MWFKGPVLGECKPELVSPRDREYLGLASFRNGMQPAQFSAFPAGRLCSACSFWALADFLTLTIGLSYKGFLKKTLC